MILGLKKILDEATFPLKKREVAAFASVNNWIIELEQRIKEGLEPKPEVKKKAERKTKVGNK